MWTFLVRIFKFWYVIRFIRWLWRTLFGDKPSRKPPPYGGTNSTAPGPRDN